MTNNSQKQQVFDLLKSIETGDSTPIGYINPSKYIQHNLAAKDGLQGFGELMAQLPPNSRASIRHASSRTAIMSSPTANMTSSVRRLALTFSVLRTEKLSNTGITFRRRQLVQIQADAP